MDSKERMNEIVMKQRTEQVTEANTGPLKG